MSTRPTRQKANVTSYLILLALFFFVAKAQADWIKIGVCSDVHCSNKPNIGYRYYTEAATKMSTAMDVWKIEDVNAIFVCGDYIDTTADYTDAMVTAVESELHDYNDIPSSVPRFYVIGNHDWDVTHDANDFMDAVEANTIQKNQNNGEYFFYDVGNLRILSVCAAYESDGITRRPGGGDGYLPQEQLEWLENKLQEADNSGKYSVIMCHYLSEPINYSMSYTATISNSNDVFGIIIKHRVACWIGGHHHIDFAFNSYQNTNAYGSRIFFKGLEGMVDNSGVSNFATLYINDQDGTVYMKGHDNCTGKRTLKYVGNDIDNCATNKWGNFLNRH